MTVRIRAHHLLCMLTYAGKGYSAAFTANYNGIVERLGKGEDMLLVAGPDDICQPLLGDDDAHCRRESVIERDGRAAAAVEALTGSAVRPGEVFILDASRLSQMRSAFQAGTVRQACGGCEWFDLCTGIAGKGYANTRLALDPRAHHS
ncbi:DUF1284 domain-containing protein [Mesorhizobium sp. YR577]|uniref:DUF1284 domain-containing protein n=1 Tax=Mesorhizobium sp. YR577 TaxID=1884373 RepID=UPI0008E84CBC|nr:DUF1284 domain-containing protein [Mesorhizobium sp. YR577]SFT48247.1 hypothetical protein SAMN05518861_101497 [Mesorhizobium sp. YR577]